MPRGKHFSLTDFLNCELPVFLNNGEKKVSYKIRTSFQRQSKTSTANSQSKNLSKVCPVQLLHAGYWVSEGHQGMGLPLVEGTPPRAHVLVPQGELCTSKPSCMQKPVFIKERLILGQLSHQLLQPLYLNYFKCQKKLKICTP